jgi:hypothetical protein
MTARDENRIHELSRLIVEEKDPAKLKALAEELGRLLTIPKARANGVGGSAERHK